MCLRIKKISELSQDEKLTIQRTYLTEGMNAAIRKLNLTLGYAMPMDMRVTTISRICKEQLELVPSNEVAEAIVAPAKKKTRKKRSANA